MIDTRNAYRRRNFKKSGASNRFLKWPLAVAMEFLDKYNAPASTDTNVEDGDDDVTDQLDESLVDTAASTTVTGKNEYKANTKRKKSDPVEEVLVHMLKKESEDDEDKGFFLSLYKDFRGLSEEQKLEAKMSLMKVIYTLKQNCGEIPPQNPVQYAASSVTGVPQDVAFVTMSPSKFQELFSPQGGQ